MLNLNADYAISEQIQIFAKVENVFDKKYYSFCLLGE